MRILVGDIGGTKTGLAVADVDGERISLSDERRYSSAESDSLEKIVKRYLRESEARCEAAAFAIAGPVQGDRSKTTNLPWELDARYMERDLDLSSVRLLNDLEAVAWGVPALGEDGFEVLHPGEDGAAGNACVVAAGTGLGEAGMYWDGTRHHPFATEGGHTDFAPLDDKELALLTHLRSQFGRVSWERVASGQGICNIYQFLVRWHQADVPNWLREEIAAGDASAIARAAGRQHCPICAEAMEMFAGFYGREAGNVALKHMALGGVYLAGGVTQKNLALLRHGDFLKSFFDKGRMEPLVRRMPVRVILEPQAPLYGAARFIVAS